jgi:hypothetical protein
MPKTVLLGILPASCAVAAPLLITRMFPSIKLYFQWFSQHVMHFYILLFGFPPRVSCPFQRCSCDEPLAQYTVEFPDPSLVAGNSVPKSVVQIIAWTEQLASHRLWRIYPGLVQDTRQDNTINSIGLPILFEGAAPAESYIPLSLIGCPNFWPDSGRIWYWILNSCTRSCLCHTAGRLATEKKER